MYKLLLISDAAPVRGHSRKVQRVITVSYLLQFFSSISVSEPIM